MRNKILLAALAVFLAFTLAARASDEEGAAIVQNFEAIKAQEMSALFDGTNDYDGATSPYGVLVIRKVDPACELYPWRKPCKHLISVNKKALYEAYLNDARPVKRAVYAKLGVHEKYNSGYMSAAFPAAVFSVFPLAIFGVAAGAKYGVLTGLLVGFSPLLLFGLGAGILALIGVAQGESTASRAKELVKNQPDTLPMPKE